jgi:hypothetical protein
MKFFIITLLLVSVCLQKCASLQAGWTSKSSQRVNTARFLDASQPLSFKNLRKVFTVEKGTPEVLESMNVDSWGSWSTRGSPKYQVGKKSPLKVYDGSELSYITSGKMEITPEATGIPVLVQKGDFVTFPDGFPCYWYVIETIEKQYYLY